MASIGRQMDNKAVEHMPMEYNSAIKKNAFESKLEPIIQSKVKSERKMHIYGI